ncbi:hypothetical protein ABBQ38_001980 [Trebouxia sp. C0009 RCD-2024]
MRNCHVSTTKGFFDNAVGAEFGKRSSAPTKATPAKPASTRPTSSKGFFDNAVGSEFAKRSTTPTRAAPKQPSSSRASSSRASSGKGFFDNAVGSEFAKRSPAPTKPAPKQSTPTRSASGGGFFDNAIGSEFAKRSPAPAKAAPKQPAPRASSSGKFYAVLLSWSNLCVIGAFQPASTADAQPCTSKGFFDSAVGAQFAKRSAAPAKPAAPKQPVFSRAASSGAGFFDSVPGAQFATRSVTPNRPAPKQASPSPPTSASDRAQVAKRSESPPKEAARKEGGLTWPASAGGFFESALGSHFASRFNLKPSENAGAKTDGPRMAASQEASEEGSSQLAPDSAGPDQPDVTLDSILVSAVR